MAYQSCRCSVALLYPVCISVFCAHLALSFLLHLYSLHHVPFMQPSSAMYFYSCALPPCSHFNLSTQRPQQLQQQWQQQPHLFSTLCTYSFYAPCACNVCISSVCSHRAHILHLSSALPDTHGNSSASLAVSHAFSITGCYAEIPQPLQQLRLFVFSLTVEIILSLSITSFFFHNSQPCTVCLIFFYTHLIDGSTSPFFQLKQEHLSQQLKR
jgi:hypothetical protein